MKFKLFLIRLITFISGLYFFIEFLLPKKFSVAGRTVFFGAYHEQISNGFAAVGACAAGLGVLNLFLHHGRKILWNDKGAIFSGALLISLLLTLFVLSKDWLITVHAAEDVGYFSMLQEYSDVVQRAPDELRSEKLRLLRNAISDKISQTRTADEDLELKAASIQRVLDANVLDFAVLKTSLQEYGQLVRASEESSRVSGVNAKLSTILIDGLFTSLGSAMFSLLGFYIAAAAYRAFRVRSFESGLLMATATIVMLGQITFGTMIWEGFPALRLWLLQVPSSAAARAIEIGASIAGLILAFRMWLSIESRSFRSK